MTETDRTTAHRMKDVDHTHPYDDTSAGRLFHRGPTLAVDGGRKEIPDEKMKDVDHTPPHGDGSKRVMERGFEYDEDEDAEDDVDDE